MTRDTLKRRRYLIGVTSVLAGSGCLSTGEQSGGTTTRPRGTEAIVPATTVAADALPTPVAGDPDADVTVATYEDFACPHCRDYSLDVQPRVLDEFGDAVRYERYDFPIPVHEKWSWAAASAARAVQADVGDGAFWEYVDLLYENQGDYSMGLLSDLAGQVDADPEAVRTAARDGVYRPVVKQDRQRGLDRGVNSTPTVFVDGRSVEQSFDEIRAAVEDALGSSG